MGRGPELAVVKAMRCVPDHISDERILGDGAFIQFGLDSVKHGEKITKAEQHKLV